MGGNLWAEKEGCAISAPMHMRTHMRTHHTRTQACIRAHAHPIRRKQTCTDKAHLDNGGPGSCMTIFRPDTALQSSEQIRIRSD